MSIFAKILCLLLVATVTSAGGKIGSNKLVGMVEKAAEPSLHSVKEACRSAKRATKLLVSQMKLDPKSKIELSPKLMLKKANRENLKSFQEFVSTKRELVIKCSKDFLKSARKRRDNVKKNCLEYIQSIELEKDKIVKNVHEKMLPEPSKASVEELKRDIKKMKQNLGPIVAKAKSLMREEVDNANERRVPWITYVAECGTFLPTNPHLQ